MRTSYFRSPLWVESFPVQVSPFFLLFHYSTWQNADRPGTQILFTAYKNPMQWVPAQCGCKDKNSLWMLSKGKSQLSMGTHDAHDARLSNCWGFIYLKSLKPLLIILKPLFIHTNRFMTPKCGNWSSRLNGYSLCVFLADWFVGVDSVQLCSPEQNEWIQTLTIEVMDFNSAPTKINTFPSVSLLT